MVQCEATMPPSMRSTALPFLVFQTLRLGIPMRRSNPDKSRHEIDALCVVSVGGENPALLSFSDHLDDVAQSLQDIISDEDRTFQRIGRLAVELVGNGRQRKALRAHDLAAGVEDGETAGAVGRLHHARLEAGSRWSPPVGRRHRRGSGFFAPNSDFSVRPKSAVQSLTFGGMIAGMRRMWSS